MADQEIVLDTEEQALQREARLAAYRQAIAEGAAAAMPDLSVDVPERSLDVGDGVSQLPGLVAQGVADELADGIVQRIIADTAVAGRTMLVVTDIDVTAASAMARRIVSDTTALTARLDTARQSLPAPESRSAVPPLGPPEDKGAGPARMALGPAAIITAAQGLQAAAKALPAVLELVKTDVTVRSSPVEVADEVIVAAVTRSLRQRDAFVRIASCTTTPDNEVTAGLGALAAARDGLADALATFTTEHLEGGVAAEVARQRAVLDALVTAHDKLLDSGKPTDGLRERIAELQQWLTDHEPAVDKARAGAALATGLIERATTYLAACQEPGAAGLAPATLAALLHEAMREGSTTDVLQVTCTRSVGETVWKEQWRGDHALHAGGLGARWILMGADGMVRSAGEHTAARSVTVKLGQPLIWR